MIYLVVAESTKLTESQIVRRLKKTITRLNKLDRDKFDYSAFVGEFNQEKECGTVCCVVGWYPKWFPESNIKWVWGGADISGGRVSVDRRLVNYHGVNEATIGTLFYGNSLWDNGKEIITSKSNMSSVTPKQVAKRFEKVIKLVQKDFKKQAEERLNWKQESL